MRRPNDVGGMPAGAVSIGAGEPAPWQKQLTALVSSLGPARRGIIRIDEFRRTREDIPEEEYNRLTYFELWAQGIANLLIEKGILTADEITSRMDQLRQRHGIDN